MRRCVYYVLFFFLPVSLLAQYSRLNPEEKYPVLQSEKKVWFATENGLFQYNPEDDAFKTLSIPSHFNRSKIRRIYQNQEWVWFLLDSGIAALHTRLNDWLFFDSTNGLPSSRVNSIAFLDDYVWVCTDNGIARFDALIEQWEVFGTDRGLPQRKVNDLLTIGKQVWILTNDGLAEYNPQFEKWRVFDLGLNGNYNRIFKFGDEIWLFGDDGMIRFNTQLLTNQKFTQSYLKRAQTVELFYSEDHIIIITSEGVFIYDKQSSAWKEFAGNSSLKDMKILAGYVNQSQLLLVTPRNVMLWDDDEDSWEFLDYSSGLSSSAYRALFSDGNLTLLFGTSFTDYRRSSSEAWRKYQFPLSSSEYGGNILKNLFDSDEGGFVKFGAQKLSFFGTRINYLSDWKQTIPDTGKIGSIQTSNEKRIDFKSQFNFDENRRMTFYYNNIDFSETMYGLRYRGKDSDSSSGDLLKELNLGDFRKEPGSNPFAEKANIYGANIWLQYGNKTPKFKKSFLSIKSGTGEVRTQKTHESFKGAKNQFHIIFNDIAFVKNRFFAVDGINKNDKITDLKVFIDSKNPSDNNPNTLINFNIAGITGNFNQLVPTEDYYISNSSNIIVFNIAIQNSWTIALRYFSNGILKEEILKLDSTISKQKLNVYYLSGQKIIPYSFSIRIFDALKNEVPLSKFGLDNGLLSGKINPDNVGYKNGYLFFPESKPFPDDVYDLKAPKSHYTIEISYSTEVSLIQLQNSNLLRGSENLKIDGVPASGGNDYIIDYTNGTLIFVREGVLNPDTRIEIEYEYYRTEFDRLHYASVNFSPSDNFFLQADWQSTKPDSNNLLGVHSEIRQNVSGSLDLRLIPGLAFQTKEKKITSGFYDFYASTSWLRIQNTYQRFDKDYSNIYKPKGIIGDISDRMILNAVSDLLNELRLSFSHSTITGNGKSISEINYWSKGPDNVINNGGLFLHGENLPGIQLNFQNERTNFVDSSEKKQFITGQLEYQVPKPILNKLSLNVIKIESYLRVGEENNFKTDTTKIKFFQNYYKVNTQFIEQVQGSFFYRVSKLDDISHYSHYPMQKSEKLLMDFSHEKWRLLQMNLRFESNLDQYNNLFSESGNYYQRQFAQANFRFSPGQLSEFFRALFFEFNYNRFLNSSGLLQRNISSDLWSFGSAENKTDLYINSSYYIKNEFRPSTQFFFTTIFEMNSQDVTTGKIGLERQILSLSEKIDVKLDLYTHLIASYRQNSQDNGFSRKLSEYEPSVWLERRWTPDFMNILNLLYRKRNTEIGNIKGNADALQAQLDLIFRKNKFLYMNYFELRQSFISQYNTESLSATDNYQFSSSTSLDIYPVSAFIIRGRFDIQRYQNIEARPSSFWLLGFNLKLSLQM